MSAFAHASNGSCLTPHTPCILQVDESGAAVAVEVPGDMGGCSINCTPGLMNGIQEFCVKSNAVVQWISKVLLPTPEKL